MVTSRIIQDDPMASDRSVCDKYTGRLTPMGPVTGRIMFGGFGIFM